MDAIPDWFQRLYDSTGLNFSVFYDLYDWNRYLAGLRMTLILSVTTILIRGYDPYNDAIDYGRSLLPLVREEVAKRDAEKHAGGNEARPAEQAVRA